MTKNKKNVLIFFTDQQRADTLGVHGNPLNLTPNIDYDAMTGTHCENAFTPQPVCLPARATLQTGKYSSEINCNTNDDVLPTTERTLAHHFNDAGYETAYFGKWHLNACDTAPFKEPQGGYKTWCAANILEFISDAYETVLFDETGKEVRLPGYRVDATIDLAIRHIDKKKDQPFFMMVSLLEPHMQNTRDDYPAPTNYQSRYIDAWTPPDLRALGGTSAQHLPGYYGMVKRIDEAYGRVKDALRSLGLLENTIVLFTSDHGCHFKTRNTEYKRSCHDSSLKIPMVWSGAQFSHGGRLPNNISLVDVPPTLLDACGIPVPDDMSGQSILPLVNRTDNNFREHIYAEISESHVGRCVRTSRWKYSIRKLPNNAFIDDFLYDIKADPWELNNIIGYRSHQQVVKVMRDRLVKQMLAIGQEKPIIIDAAEVDSKQYAVTGAEAFL